MVVFHHFFSLCLPLCFLIYAASASFITFFQNSSLFIKFITGNNAACVVRPLSVFSVLTFGCVFCSLCDIFFTEKVNLLVEYRANLFAIRLFHILLVIKLSRAAKFRYDRPLLSLQGDRSSWTISVEVPWSETLSNMVMLGAVPSILILLLLCADGYRLFSLYLA